jgi:hypothetical protein
MDINEITTGVKKWYPIFASILSIILDSIAFMVGIGWSSQKFGWTILFALLGTMALSGALILLIFHYSRSGTPQSTTTIGCKEIYNLCNPQNALYKKELTIKVNRPISFYITFPPNSDGEEKDFRVYIKENGKETPLKFDISKRYGRKVIIINFGQTRLKNEVITNLCVECKLINSFSCQSDGVAISSEAGQKECEIEVLFSKEPSSYNSFVYYHNNFDSAEKAFPKMHFGDKGECIVVTDFSEFVSKNSSFEFATIWSWNISTLKSE